MSDREDHEDGAPAKLSVRDSIAEPADSVSLSDSDPEDPTIPFDAEVEDLSSGEDSSDGDNPKEPTDSSLQEPLFQLKGAGVGFSARSHCIFDCLESAAKRATPGLGEDNIIDGPFVRPILPPPKKDGEKGGLLSNKQAPVLPSSKGVPDYVAHPERWTKYSLEGVPETSNSRNSQVAQEYIQSLRKQRQGALGGDAQKPFSLAFNQDHSSSSEGKIVFSRPGQTSERQPGRKCGEELKKAVGLCHLEDLPTEEECVHPGTMEGKRKRKRESENAERDSEQPHPLAVGFNIGRKVNRKNFRRISEKDDDDH